MFATTNRGVLHFSPIAVLRQRPLAKYRQDGWVTALNRVATHLATGAIRRQAEQWDFINVAVDISGATSVTNNRIAELIDRLRTKGINPTPWLEQTTVHRENSINHD